jgi:hypothetical protein
MAPTSSQWLLKFTELTGTSHVRNIDIARALRAKGLYAKPSRGRGHVKTRTKASDLVNFILAQAADEPSHAAEVVTNLRQMKFGGFEAPYFGDGDCGNIFDLMIEGLGGGPRHSPLADPRNLPNEIILSTRPYQATLIWRSDKAPGGFLRANTYTQAWPEYNRLVVRKTFIDPKLFEFARQLLNDETEAKNAVLPGTALQVDQPKAHATDRSNSLAAPNLPRVRVRPQHPPTRSTKS